MNERGFFAVPDKDKIETLKNEVKERLRKKYIDEDYIDMLATSMAVYGMTEEHAQQHLYWTFCNLLVKLEKIHKEGD